ncbi:hypothetical protein CRE_15349 [Caenorhabditis remanei]|uniref:CWH43-like N-terminal domain-containing protein n=1 Tax=Caenorhabditis remanei TaxID=31234 RepID=E3MCD8_CAERE|nr:hypothetical protein CRE_15349 [Caenorhabditis remanei]
MSFYGSIFLGFGTLTTFIAVVFFYDLFIFYTNVIVKYYGYPFMQFFSSKADRHFQSCVLAIGGNICAFLIFIVVFVRYRQMRSIFYQLDMGYPFCWNTIAKWFGYLSAIGLFVVANVQETAIIPIHMLAALVMYGVHHLHDLPVLLHLHHLPRNHPGEQRLLHRPQPLDPYLRMIVEDLYVS